MKNNSTMAVTRLSALLLKTLPIVPIGTELMEMHHDMQRGLTMIV